MALDALYPRLSPGGFVIIDDSNAIQQCKDAVMDYRARFGIEAPLQKGDWTEVWWRKAVATLERLSLSARGVDIRSRSRSR